MNELEINVAGLRNFVRISMHLASLEMYDTVYEDRHRGSHVRFGAFRIKESDDL